MVFNTDLSIFENDEQLLEYLNSYIPIKNPNDLYEIFSNQLAFHLKEEPVNNDFLNVYNIFFNDSWLPENIKITIFSGGSGANCITEGLLDYTGKIDMLINAYDDLEGTSNGSIRRHLNVLGPSDIAKNLTTLLDNSYIENVSLKNFLKYRFSRIKNLNQLRYDLEAIANNEVGICDETLQELFRALTPSYS